MRSPWSRCRRTAAQLLVLLTVAAAPLAAEGRASAVVDPLQGAADASARYVGEQSHVDIVEVDGSYDRAVDGAVNALPRTLVAKEVFAHHPDDYDFLITFSTFPFDTGDAVAFYLGVQNGVQGIGLPLYDNSALFGSTGRLQGYIDMEELAGYASDPLDPEFERTLAILAHEILHQWGAHVRFRRPDGTLSDALLGKDGSHWSYLLDSDGSVLYGNDWRANGDGSYTSRAAETFFSPLDLYLAGFFGPDEVPPFVLLDNPAVDPNQLPRRGAQVTGTPIEVTIDDVIAAEGPRIPAAEEAQKELRAAFVLLVRPGEQPTSAQIQALERIRQGLLERFTALTGGRGILEVFPEALPAGEPGAPGTVPGGPLRGGEASVADGLGWLRSRQQEEGYWQDRPGTRLRDTVTALATLETLDPSFTGSAPALGWLAGQGEATTDFSARKTATLAARGLDTAEDRAALVALQNPDGGWGLGEGYASDPMDSALAVRALAAAGATAEAAVGADFLVANQGADGGWPAAVGGPSRTGVTAAVVEALAATGRLDGVAATVGPFLASRQNPDGGFGDSPSTVHDTAGVLEALTAAGAIGAVDGPAALSYLASRQTVDGSWAGSVYATALALDALQRGRFPNWRFAADPVADPAAPRDGERVRLTFTVSNDGSVATPAGALRLFEGDPDTGGTPSGDDLAIPELAPGAAVTLTRSWDSLDHPGTNLLVAVLDPDGALDELSERDNRADLTLEVAPAPDSAELEITPDDLLVSPAHPAELPADLALTATVRNLGKLDVPAVAVELLAGSPETAQVVDRQTVAVPQRSSTPVNFTFTLTEPGTTQLTVRVDPDDEIPEGDEGNNAASTSVTTTAAIDLAVAPEDLSADGTLALGSDVTLRAQLHNRGTVDAPEAAVRLIVTDGTTTRELPVSPVLLAAGGSAERTAPWRVDLTGDLVFRVTIDGDDAIAETDETNNSASVDLTVGAVSDPNLSVASQDLTFSPDPALEGAGVELSALVRNTGGTTASDLEVGFYEGDPEQGGQLLGAIQTIPTLGPGAQATVAVTLPPLAGTGDRLIVVVVDPADRFAEATEDDNRAFRTLHVLALPDLVVSPAAIETVPALPEAGAAVTTTVTVANTGEQDAQDVTVRLTADGVPVGPDQALATLPAGSSGAVSFPWTFPDGASSVLLAATVDGADTIAEGSEANNRAERELAAFEPGRAVSNPYFSPDGDGVQDTTVYSFTLAAPATVTVRVLDDRNEMVRSHTGPELQGVTRGRFEWDGRDDTGRVVPDGDYLFVVVDGAGRRLDQAAVTLDTDGWPLFEAIGTPFERIADLSCSLEDPRDLWVLDGDAEAVFIDYNNGGYNTEGNLVGTGGIYRAPLAGGGPEPVLRLSYPDSLRVSRDGQKIAVDRQFDTGLILDGDGSGQDEITLQGFSFGFPGVFQDLVYTERGYYDHYSVKRLPLDGSGPERTLLEADGTVTFRQNGYRQDYFSPDGEKLVYFQSGVGLGILDLETGETTHLALEPFSEGDVTYFGFKSWSPDGRWILCYTDRDTGPADIKGFAVFDRDGTFVRVIEPPLGTFNDIEAFADLNAAATPEPDWRYVDAFGPSFSPAGDEIVFDADFVEGGTGYSASWGSLVRANLVTGALHTVQYFEPSSYFYSFHVSTWDGHAWVERGELHHSLVYSEHELDLSDYLPDPDGEYKVRIRQSGLESGQADRVSLRLGPAGASGRGSFPTEAHVAADGTDVLDPLLVVDRDVVDLHEREVEVRWGDLDAQAGSAGVSLSLVAREEDLSKRHALPFTYPAADGQTYHHVVGSGRALVVDGRQTGADGLGEPLFATWTSPDTGHPSETVYGYVSSDDRFLYGALDFTVDNTEDGDRDWASLWVETPEGWKEFRITVSDERWGAVGFTRTGKVPHRHKYYEFRIPLDAISATVGETVAVRFQAYGTAALFTDETYLPADGQVLWAPSGRSLLYSIGYGGYNYLIDLDGDAAPRRVLDGFNTLHLQYLSRSGNALIFTDGRDILDPQSACYNPSGYASSSYFALTSLANDSVALDAAPTADGRGLVLSGTATDLHFARWRLEYASEEIPDFWNPVLPPVTTPAVDEDLATWIPPGPGAFLVRLTVEDLAGNRRSVVRRFASASADAVSVTDLSVAPRYISPDGDDVQDATTIHYRVLAPVHLQIAVLDGNGDRVRSFTRDHTTIGDEYDVVWDGRDDAGLPVPDGRYRIEVQGYAFTVTVDTVAPVFDGFDLEGPGTVARTPAGDTVLDLGPRATWCVHDEHPADGTLEVGQGATPTVWKALGGAGVVTSCPFDRAKWSRRALTLGQLTGYSFRLEARDLAGNVARATVPPASEELFIYRFRPDPPGSTGELLFPEHAVPSSGAVLLEQPATSPAPVRMRIAETAVSDLAQVVLEVQRVETVCTVAPCVGSWVEVGLSGVFDPDAVVPGATIPDGIFDATWDSALLDPAASYHVRLRGHTVDGRYLYSNTLTLRFATDGIEYRGQLVSGAEPPTDDPAATRSQLDLALGRAALDPAESFVLWAIETIEDPLTDVALVVTSEDDPRYAGGKALAVKGEAGGVLVFDGSDLLPCKTYSARVIGRVVPADGGDPRPVESNPLTTPLSCLVLSASVDPPALAACGESPDPARSVRLTPQSLDGVPLQLLTVALDDPLDVIESVNRPAPDVETAFTLDTTPLEEGVHTLYARLTNGEGDEVVHRLALAVDRSAPRVELTYPGDGQRLCGMPDGTGARTVTLEGSVSDFGLPEPISARFEIRQPDGSWEGKGGLSVPEAGVPSPGPIESLVSRTDPEAWSLSEVSGAVTARLVAADAGGHRVCSAPVDFVFDGAVEGFTTSVAPALLSPDGDGVADAAQIAFSGAEATVVDVTIHAGTESEVLGLVSVDPVGPALRTLATGLATAGAGSAVWDGRDDGGAVVPDGLYAVVVQATDGCGNTVRSVRGVRVDTHPPTVEILAPRSGDGLPLMVEVTGTASDPSFATYTLEHGVGAAPFTWETLARSDRPVVAGTLGRWNTYGLAGAQTLRLTATDRAGNAASTVVTLTLPPSDSIVTLLEAVPEAFSPDGNGVSDGTSVRFGLAQDARVDLEIAAADGTSVRTLAAAEELPAGAALRAWDGRSDAGQRVADGTYEVHLRATAVADASVSQDERVSVVVDTTAPAIEISRPRDGFAAGTAAVTGRITDPRLDSWVVELTDSPDLPDWQVIGQGGALDAADPGSTLAAWQDLPEGPYAVRVRAADTAGNRAERVIPFEVDATEPVVTLDAPASGAVLGAALGPVAVRGAAVEEHPRLWRLELGAGDDPATWTVLTGGDGLPPDGDLFAWGVGALPDGLYTVRLRVEDLGGLTGDTRVPVVIDNTAPAAAITTPAADAWVTGPTTVTGTAWDLHLAELRLEVAPAGTDAFSELGRSTAAVQNGPLLAWQALPPDGTYRLRLTVEDRAANRVVAEIPVRIDTRPPAAPLGLAAALAEDGGSVTLTWQAAAEPDVIGYQVERDGVRLTTEPVAATTFVDPLATDGTFSYAVRAVDRAGQESAPSATAEVVRDTTPPGVVIHRPLSGAQVSGLVDVQITASSSDFSEYRLSVGPADGSAPLTLLRRSPVPVRSEVVAQWNASSLPQGASYRFRLEAEDVRGNVGVAEAVVTIDNQPPTAPTGLTATATGADVDLAWTANGETDLAGYLLYRDGQIVPATGGSTEDLVRRALHDPAYSDLELPDGTFTYRVAAIDRAGNVSPLSAPASVTIDRRAPHAEIVQPEAGARFDGPAYTVATVIDRDVAEVAFEWRPAGGSWASFATRSAAPWEATWDPSGLDYGDYELRAVATDAGGQTDPAPAAVPVSYTDLERPAPATGLAVRVDGGAVHLSWSAGTEPDLAGYFVDRVPENGSPVRATPTPVTGTSFVDTGVPDDRYAYSVVPVDVYGNEALVTETAEAEVYTPELEHPWSPTAHRTADLAGRARPGSSVAVEVVRPDGVASLPPVAADAEGRFRLDGLALGVGANELAAVATDPDGDRSKRAAVQVTVVEPPSAPTGLTASVTDRTVALSWTPNLEPDILGYRVFLDGAPRHPDTVRTGLSATASGYDGYSYPSRAVDGRTYTYWTPALDQPLGGQWLAARWVAASVVVGVDVLWYDPSYSAADYDVQVFDASLGAAGDWRTLFEIRGNSAQSNTLELPEHYVTNGVRLVLHGDAGVTTTAIPVRLAELSVRYRPVTATASESIYTGDGLHELAVSAVDQYGFESVPSAPLEVPVGDAQAPPAVTLTASVDGADAVLTWTESAATDLRYYVVYRDGEEIDYTYDLTGRTYRDPSLANGTYRYTVRAFDQVGNASDPSNEAVVTVATAVPEAPVALAVADPGTGDALDLTWSPPAGGPEVTGYAIERAAASGGPYDRVGQAPGTTYRDRGLDEGAAYYYVVRAVDALGNAGAPSNEASGVPVDTTGPTAVLHHPAAAGAPYETATPLLPLLVGTTAPGAPVTVYRDGAPIGATTAGTVSSVDRVPYDVYGLLRLAPDGRTAVADDGYTHDLVDFTTGTGRPLLGLDDTTTFWFRDGEHLLAGRYDSDTGETVLGSYGVGDGTFKDLVRLDWMDGAVPSPDGRLAAVVGQHDQFEGLFLIDLTSGETTDLVADDSRTFDVEGLAWSPDGTHLADAHRISYDWQIEVAAVATGTVTVVEDAPRDSWNPTWAPGGDELAYAASTSGWDQLWTYRLDTGAAEQLTTDAVDHILPQWSPDGSRIAYLRDFVAVDALDLETGEVTVLEVLTNWWDSLVWNGSGRLGTIDDGQAVRITPPGLFAVEDVPLLVGDNAFTAQAVDEAGNLGALSAPAVVTLTAAGGPNLAVSATDLTVLPAVPLAGQTVTLSATVRSTGAVDAPASSLSLVLLDPAGAAHPVADVPLDPLASGTDRTVSETATLDGAPGRWRLVAVVDPLDRLFEADENDNRAEQAFPVPADGTPVVFVATDRDEYGPEEDVAITAELANAGDEWSGTLKVAIEDAAGYPVEALDPVDVPALAAGSLETHELTWSTGAVFAGDYRVVARLLDGAGMPIGEAEAPFAIASASRLSASVTTDRAMFAAGETVHLAGTVQYQEGNGPLAGASTRLAVLAADGTPVAEWTEPLGELLPGAEASVGADWASGGAVPGAYRARLEVLRDGSPAAAAESPFELTAPDLGVLGTLALSETAPPVGAPVTAHFAVTNGTPDGLTSLPLQVAVTRPADGAVVASEDLSLDLAAGATTEGDVTLATDTLGLDEYLVLLRATPPGAAAPQTLAAAALTPVDGTPPDVRSVEPADGAELTTTAVTVRMVVFDPLSGVDRVEVSLDGGAPAAATLASPADGLWTLELTGLASGDHAVAIRAVDGAGNETLATVAFTVTAGEPELVASQSATLAFDADGDGVPSPGDELAYEVTVTNSGGAPATGVALADPVPEHTALVAGSVETTTGTVVAVDPAVEVALGTLDAGASATVTFHVTVDLPVPAGVDRVTSQGVVTSAELPALFTDDPALGGDADPTVTMITAAPELVAEKVAALVEDPDGDGVPSPGDTLEYTVTVKNVGNTSATAVGLADPVPENTALVAGSAITSQGTVTEGDPVLADLGEIPGRADAVVTFRVMIDLPIAAGVREVSNQGLVASAELPDVVTDDPAVDGPADATVTPVTAAPVLLVEKTDALFEDRDGDGLASPGDEILYRITAGNTGNTAATGLSLLDPTPEHTALVDGTVQVSGGTLDGVEPIIVHADLLPVGDELVVTFRVRIEEPFPLDLLAVANGAELASAELDPVPSDDPETAAPDDPTVTEVFIRPAISIADLEVEEHAGPAVFTISLSEPSNRPVAVDWATRDAGATAGLDYRAASGQVVFAPGETEATVAIEVLDDALDELDEGIALVLSGASGGDLPPAEADAEAVATVLDDDPPPFVSVADVALGEADGEAVFRIALSGPSGLGIQVGYATLDGTATAGSDYTATSGTVVIPAGLTGAEVRVPVTDDAVDERDETFTLTLEGVINAIPADPEAVATIRDDDEALISIDDVAVDEGDDRDGGSADALFPVRLATEADREITVRYATEAGTATAGEDFTPVAGTLVFAAGETEGTVAVPILGDRLLEPDEETFTVVLSDPTETGIDDGLAVGTIRDDERCPGPNLLANPGAEERLVSTDTGDELPGWLEVEGTEWTRRLSDPEPFEGEASFWAGTVERGELAQDADIAAYDVRIDDSSGQRFAFSGRVRTFDEVPPDTARIVVEYRDRTNTVVLDAFDSGELVSPFEWTEVADERTAPEGTGWIRVRLIADRFTDGSTDAYFDALSLRSLRAPVLTVGDATVYEGDGEPVDADFRVVLSCPFDREVEALYATADETATAGTDYTAVAGTVRLPSGTTEAEVGVPILGDTVHELHETFRLELSDAHSVDGSTGSQAEYVVLLDPTGIGLITDDDFCARSHGFWKTHQELWPTDWLEIGGVEYGAAELEAFLGAKGGDATLHLARELVATKLNLLVGSAPEILPTVEEADAFLAAFPPGSEPKGADRQAAEALKDLLEAYNNPTCQETPVVP